MSKTVRSFFLDEIINIKNLDPNKIKRDENSYKNILTYGIRSGQKSFIKSFIP